MNCARVKILEKPFREAKPVSVPCGIVSPARTGPLEGPNFPLEDRDLSYLASCPVEIAIVRRKCATLGKSQGSQPKLGPFSAGQTLPP